MRNNMLPLHPLLKNKADKNLGSLTTQERQFKIYHDKVYIKIRLTAIPLKQE
jgi:hypothetical protein